MRRSWLFITLSLGSVLLAGAAAVQPLIRPHWPALITPQYSLAGAASKPDRATADATTGEASASAARDAVAARGRVEPGSEQLELAIGLVGTLSHVYVDEGDAVRRGQLLAELVNDDQRARVDEASANVQLRQAELEKLLNGARAENRRQAAAQAEEARTNLELATRQLARRRPLAASGVTSQETLDEAISSQGVAAAKNDLNSAALALIMAPPRDEDVLIAKANLSFAQANLAEQRSLLEKTELRSPIDGIVLRRYLKTGETISIQPLMPIIEVGDTSRLRVRAQIDETDIARVGAGQRVSVSADAFPNEHFGGVISRVDHRMGHKTIGSDRPTEKSDAEVLDVLIDLDPGAGLPVGLRVDVYIETAKLSQTSTRTDNN